MSHATIQLGTLQPGQNATFNGSVARGSTKAYEFQVNNPTVISATLSGLSSNAELILLNASKASLASSSSGKANDSFTSTFSPGVYFAEVVGLGKHKARYQIDLNATALPTPKPVPPTTSASSPIRPPATNPGTPTASTPSTPTASAPSTPTASTPSTPTGPTIQQFEAALESAIKKGVDQFARDATVVEVLAPTIAHQYVDPELAQVDRDALNGNDFQAFADIQTLGQTLLQEAEFTVSRRLPSSAALLGYSPIVKDLEVVGALKEISFEFLEAIASRMSSHSSSTPAYWTTGALGSGSSAGVLSTTNQAILTSYSSSDLSRVNHYVNSMEGSLAANDLWYQEAQQFDPYQSITEDNGADASDPSLDPTLSEIDG